MESVHVPVGHWSEQQGTHQESGHVDGLRGFVQALIVTNQVELHKQTNKQSAGSLYIFRVMRAHLMVLVTV